MITDKLIQVAAWLARQVASLFPSLPSPDWLTDALLEPVAFVGSHIAGFGAWVPFGAIAAALPLVLGALAVAFGVKLVRIIVSLFTAGGGSAA